MAGASLALVSPALTQYFAPRKYQYIYIYGNSQWVNYREGNEEAEKEMERGKDGVSARKLGREEKWKRERGKRKETRWKGKSEGERREKKRKGDSVWCCCIGPWAGRWGWSLCPRCGYERQLSLGATSGSYSVILVAATTIPSPHCWDMFFYTVPIISMTLTSNRKLEKKKSDLCDSEFWDLF